MTEIQKEEFRVAARERKRLFEKKELKKKFTFFRKSFFCFKQNQEQNMQNFKLFQSKRTLEKLMRSTRSQYRLSHQYIAHSSNELCRYIMQYQNEV